MDGTVRFGISLGPVARARAVTAELALARRLVGVCAVSLIPFGFFAGGLVDGFVDALLLELGEFGLQGLDLGAERDGIGGQLPGCRLGAWRQVRRAHLFEERRQRSRCIDRHPASTFIMLALMMLPVNAGSACRVGRPALA